MILYANGCSMTYGAELGGETIINGIGVEEHNPDFRKKNVWPSILGELLKVEKTFNDAVGGAGNDRMFRTTMEWTSNYLQNNNGKDLFVIIGWSAPERTEYRINDEWRNILSHFSPTNVPQNVIDLQKFHVNEMMDERKDYTTSINYMLALQSWLQTNSIPFLFFNALHIHWPKIKEVQILRNYIDRSRYYKFDDRDFCMFTFCDKYPRGPRNHTLEEGHRTWANHLAQYIINNKLNEVN